MWPPRQSHGPRGSGRRGAPPAARRTRRPCLARGDDPPRRLSRALAPPSSTERPPRGADRPRPRYRDVRCLNARPGRCWRPRRPGSGIGELHRLAARSSECWTVASSAGEPPATAPTNRFSVPVLRGCLTACKSAAGDHGGARTNLRSAARSWRVPPTRRRAPFRPVGCICGLGRPLDETSRRTWPPRQRHGPQGAGRRACTARHSHTRRPCLARGDDPPRRPSRALAPPPQTGRPPRGADRPRPRYRDLRCPSARPADADRLRRPGSGSGSFIGWRRAPRSAGPPPRAPENSRPLRPPIVSVLLFFVAA